MGNTPRGPAFELSPTKISSAVPAMPPSSSPAPRRQSGADPKSEVVDVEELQDEEPAFDLTKLVSRHAQRLHPLTSHRGFMSISKFHASSNNGVALGNTNKG
jgi:hypothetical protein